MDYNSDDFHTVWSDYRDVVLLELIKKKASVINMGRTVLATGVVALVTEKFIKQIGDEYTEYEVVQRMKYLKQRYLDFEEFISTTGIAYDFVNNVVTAGEAYFMKVDMCKENPKNIAYRCFGERIYPSLRTVFTYAGIAAMDLEWMTIYFSGDEDALKGLPECP